ncbi:DNA cytosine methyltransferase [Pseudoalteromonas piscicida]|uniref:Cytosine-specific methyltransferase n=1 Tax=Pseudoalteromonas piscicida TaxID=43662 RepID=A0AAD0RKR9_PSEO7|nr:DNA cytosine methyltransferase [Pseudoalteromonas piscicida]ASD68716.1 DNA (cytosine-5-)-methyltransferase [Pseudoalteromonas piscicida]AXR03774.1 DNA cytosine methyltransferase [Pseudoalteromonas piscicida]
MPTKKSYKVVDLYSGCGGFGLGAELAGFETFAAIDVDTTLQSSYKINFPNTRVLNADLSKTNSDTWKMIIGDERIDVVIGGPPCQGYSRMGHSDKNDPRRSLLGHFFRNVNLINPKLFVMENVEGLLDSKNVNELKVSLDILDNKYKVLTPFVVDASDYGAPTKRRRVIVVGYNPELVNECDISELIPKNIKRNTVKDAISDLAHPIKQSKDKQDLGWAQLDTKEPISSYAKAMRKKPRNGLGDNTALNRLMNNETSGFFETIHSKQVLERYAALKQGEVDKTSRGKRLDWQGLCPTLRAGTGSDKGSHQAVRPIHPEQNRVITVREAARLQGFPDWFIFHPTKWHSFRMIGNSVSPLMAKHILEVLKKKIKLQEAQNTKHLIG